MRFAYEVKYHGVYYPAGTDVPIGKSAGAKTPAGKSGKVDKPVKEEVKPEPKKERKYPEDALNVPYMTLKSMARAEGFKVQNTAKAEEIKEMLRTL